MCSDVLFPAILCIGDVATIDRKSTRLNSSHLVISYAVFCLKKKIRHHHTGELTQPLDLEYHTMPRLRLIVPIPSTRPIGSMHKHHRERTLVHVHSII